MWKLVALLAWLALLAAGISAALNVTVRDPRCDTPARYEAMSEGADCYDG